MNDQFFMFLLNFMKAIQEFLFENTRVEVLLSVLNGERNVRDFVNDVDELKRNRLKQMLRALTLAALAAVLLAGQQRRQPIS